MAINRSASLFKVRTVIVICCLALVLGILGYAYLSDGNKTVLDKAEIESNIQENKNVDLGYSYTSTYIKKYGIGNINSYKVNTVEKELRKSFYKELPEEYTLAEQICTAFLEKYYDTIDLNDKESVTDAILNCYFESIGDPYAFYRSATEFEEYLGSLEGNESFVGIGVMINAETLEVMTVYKDSGAYEAGVRPGDIIYAVEGKTSETTSTEELSNMLKGEEGTTVNVTVKRGEELIDLTITRKLITERSVTYEIDDDKIGYIYISQFQQTTFDQFKEAVDYCEENGALALVIDVRYNPGGLLDSVVAIIDYLVPDAQDRRIASYTMMGEEIVYYTMDGHSVDVPISVICNEYTASAGELFTAAMRDFSKDEVIKATVVGTKTYGKGVVQTSFTLYDMSGITFTIGYYNPPCDVNFDGLGVIPDVEVKEVEDKDLPFEKAKEAVLDYIYTGTDAVSIFAKAA